MALTDSVTNACAPGGGDLGDIEPGRDAIRFGFLKNELWTGGNKWQATATI